MVEQQILPWPVVLIMGLVLQTIGFFYLKGLFRAEMGGPFKYIINTDKMLFGERINRHAVLVADEIAFLINSLGAIIIMLFLLGFGLNIMEQNTLTYLTSIIFLPCLLVGCFFRYAFIFFYRNKKTDEIPFVWPIKRMGNNSKGKHH